MKRRIHLAHVGAIAVALQLSLPERALGTQDAEEKDSRPENTTPPLRPSELANGDVEATLRALYAEVEAFSKIEVSVSNGVAKLSGTAPTPTAREDVERIASRMAGVLYVENRVSLPPLRERGTAGEAGATPERGAPTARDERIAERLQAVFARVDDLEDIEVEVSAGVVHLGGETASPESREKAEALAKSIAGVVFVDNDVEETTDVSERLSPSVEKLFSRIRATIGALPLFGLAIVILVAFWLFARLVGRADRIFRRITRNRLLQEVLQNITKTLVIILGLFLALEILGATALVGAVLGTAGVVGLALGFAFRDIIENYLASIILSVRRPFRSMDLVQIGEHVGKVIRMTTRDTVLMTLDGNHLTLPNATVFKSDILNFSRNPLRRVGVQVGIGTDVDLKRAIQTGVDAIGRTAGTVPDPKPYALVERLGESSVDVCFYAWVDQNDADFLNAESEAVRRIKGALDEAGIDLPPPSYRVHLQRKAAPPGHIRDEARAPIPPAGELEDAEILDVEPERHIEGQVARDLAESPEADLLRDGDAAPSPRDRRERRLARRESGETRP